MPWNTSDIPSLDGRAYVVTGANSGIGFEAAAALAQRGARVVLACRTEAKARGALDELSRRGARGEAVFAPLDLASLASVRAFAEALPARCPGGLDGLVNNAGVMALPRALTVDGFETQLGTNHLGHFALTAALLPTLAARPAARVVNVSSAVHYVGRVAFDDLMGARRYHPWAAYAQSKLANLLFTRELARRLAARHPHVLAVAAHPGYAATNLQATTASHGGPMAERFFALGNAVAAQSAAAGALPTLRALVDPEARNDDFYGPAFLGWGPPERCARSARARDDDAARRLWDESARLTGCDYPAS